LTKVREPRQASFDLLDDAQKRVGLVSKYRFQSRKTLLHMQVEKFSSDSTVTMIKVWLDVQLPLKLFSQNSPQKYKVQPFLQERGCFGIRLL
jgi:hypothetical protein